MSAPGRKNGRGRPRGKRSDPDCIQVSAYILRRTHEAVRQKLAQQAGAGDFSLLVEKLLREWLGVGQFHKRLRAEISRRRKEVDIVKSRGRWVPDNFGKMDLVRILDWIECELDGFSNGQSVNGRDGAVGGE